MKNQNADYIHDYKYGFTTDIENIRAPKGLTEETIKFISKIKKEPKWMLEWRMKAFQRLKVSKEPNWQKPKFPKIDYQDLYYYSAPKSMDDKPKSLDELDPKLLETYKKLVRSTRGATGGYILEKPSSEIKLSNIIFAVDEEVKMLNCKKQSKKGCTNKSTKCITHNLWDQLDQHINGFFEEIK